MKLTRNVRAAIPAAQSLAREGDRKDGALQMRGGPDRSSLDALKARDEEDPRRVAIRAARSSAANPRRRSKVSLAPVKGMGEPDEA